VSKQRVRSFLAGLPGGRPLASTLTSDQLAHGALVSSTIRVDPSSGPTDRAGSGGGSIALWLLPLALLLPLPALLARR
jgi:hypothetical protein